MQDVAQIMVVGLERFGKLGVEKIKARELHIYYSVILTDREKKKIEKSIEELKKLASNLGAEIFLQSVFPWQYEQNAIHAEKKIRDLYERRLRIHVNLTQGDAISDIGGRHISEALLYGTLREIGKVEKLYYVTHTDKIFDFPDINSATFPKICMGEVVNQNVLTCLEYIAEKHDTYEANYSFSQLKRDLLIQPYRGEESVFHRWILQISENELLEYLEELQKLGLIFMFSEGKELVARITPLGRAVYYEGETFRHNVCMAVDEKEKMKRD